jgi:adenylate kinase family enzyme
MQVSRALLRQVASAAPASPVLLTDLARAVFQRPTGSPPRILLLLGGPGSGKGTTQKLLSERLGWRTVSAGALLRARAEAGDMYTAATLTSGKVVPHEVSARIVLEHLHENAGPDGEHWIVDGFPRSADAAELWERVGGTVWRALGLEVDDEDELRGRLTARGRPDDVLIGVVGQRLAQHRKEMPLLREYYGKRRVWGEVNGVGSKDDVYTRVESWLDAQK